MMLQMHLLMSQQRSQQTKKQRSQHLRHHTKKQMQMRRIQCK
jgi:hypothetical protein